MSAKWRHWLDKFFLFQVTFLWVTESVSRVQINDSHTVGLRTPTLLRLHVSPWDNSKPILKSHGDLICIEHSRKEHLCPPLLWQHKYLKFTLHTVSWQKFSMNSSWNCLQTIIKCYKQEYNHKASKVTKPMQTILIDF